MPTMNYRCPYCDWAFAMTSELKPTHVARFEDEIDNHEATHIVDAEGGGGGE